MAVVKKIEDLTDEEFDEYCNFVFDEYGPKLAEIVFSEIEEHVVINSLNTRDLKKSQLGGTCAVCEGIMFEHEKDANQFEFEDESGEKYIFYICPKCLNENQI